MLMQMKSGRRRSGPSRLELCARSGCKCICHEPKKESSLWIVYVLLFFLMYGGFWMLIAKLQQQENAKHPPEPYYCTGITSTGAPTDCHPAVLPPDVLKQYEDHFKK